MKDVPSDKPTENTDERPLRETKSGGPRLVEVRIDEPRSRFSPPTSQRGKLFLALAVVLILVVSFGVATQGPWKSKVPAGAAFVIGDHVVTEGDLDKRMDTLRALYGVVAPKGAKALDGFRRDSAKSFAVSLILDKQQAKRKITVSDKQAGDVLDRFIAEQFGDGGRDEFVRTLGNVGTSEREILDEIRRQVSLGLLMEEIIGKVEITDKQLASAFADRKKELATPELRTLRNIVVTAESDARDAFDRLKKGESFEEVAADISIDESTKDKGGDLGEVSFNELERPVAKVAFDVSKGKLYGPVEGQFGWNVGYVSDVQPATPADFAKIGEQFRERLESEEARDRWRAWLSKQIRSADVDYADKYLPADPDAAPPIGSQGAAAGNPPGAPITGQEK